MQVLFLDYESENMSCLAPLVHPSNRCNKRLMVWEQQEEEEQLQQQFKRRTPGGEKPLPTPLMISLPSSSATPAVHTSPQTHDLANDRKSVMKLHLRVIKQQPIG